MFDTNYFLDLLRGGQDLQTIGTNIAAAMNEAQAQYVQEQEEKRLAAEKDAHKRAVMDRVIEAVTDYIAITDPALADRLVHDDADIAADLIDALDAIVQTWSLLGDLEDAFAHGSYSESKSQSDDEILGKFIKSLF